MVNRALAVFQWKSDYSLAETICREASVIDPQCDIAVATLAQLLLQQNKVHEAVGMFARSAEMSRTEPELINALTYENVNSSPLLLQFLGCHAILAILIYSRSIGYKSTN